MSNTTYQGNGIHNVLFLHYGGESLRGSEHCLINLLSNLDRGKINPVVICNRISLCKRLVDIKVKAIKYHIPQVTIEGRNTKLEFFKWIKSFIFFSKTIRANKIDLVYSNSGLPAQLGFFMARYSQIPLICHIHAPHSRRFAWMWLFKYADRVIFVSNYIKSTMVEKVTFSNTTKVVYNGIDTVNRFFPPNKHKTIFRESLGLSSDDIVIGQVGSLNYLKGVDILIDAFAKIKTGHNVKLVLVGEGPEEQNLKELASRLGVKDSVLFFGYRDDIDNYYKYVLNIKVLASRFEGLGLSIIEAGACGLPVVGSRCGGIPEVIEDRVSGFLFSVNDTNELAEQLSELIRNPALRKKMGKQGRSLAKQKFDLMTYVKNIEHEITRLL